MRSNGIDVPGIFIFTTGVEFTKDDILNNGGNLYYVINDFKANSEDDLLNPNKCRPYYEYIAGTELGPVNTSKLHEIINTYIKGINKNFVDTRYVSSIEDINKGEEFTTTAIYKVVIDENFEGELVAGTYIFRSYKFQDNNVTKVLQEFINISNGIIWIRSGYGDSWSNFISLPNSGELAENYLNVLANKIDKYQIRYNRILKNGNILYKLYEKEGLTTYNFSTDELNLPYLKVFLECGDSVTNLDIDLNLGNKTYESAGIELQVTVDGGNVTLVSINESWVIKSIIATKPIESKSVNNG